MTRQFLSPMGLPQLAVADGDTSPSGGTYPALAWSTLLGGPVFWDTVAWRNGLDLFPGSAFKKSCAVATTANITLSGTQTIDGIAVAVGDRVLAKNQTTASTNGIYVVSATAWARSGDANTAAEIASALVCIDKGTANGGKLFTNTFKSTDVLGTTNMPWYGVITTLDVLTAVNGGTGQSSYAVGDLLYASSATALSKLADVATGNVLLSGGIGVAPSYGKVGLTTHVSGVLPVANGGTGLNSLPSGGPLTRNSYSALVGASLQGTTNRVTVTSYESGLGDISYTFSTPQDIHAAAVPTFEGMEFGATGINSSGAETKFGTGASLSSYSTGYQKTEKFYYAKTVAGTRLRLKIAMTAGIAYEFIAKLRYRGRYGAVSNAFGGEYRFMVTKTSADALNTSADPYPVNWNPAGYTLTPSLSNNGTTEVYFDLTFSTSQTWIGQMELDILSGNGNKPTATLID